MRDASRPIGDALAQEHLCALHIGLNFVKPFRIEDVSVKDNGPNGAASRHGMLLEALFRPGMGRKDSDLGADTKQAAVLFRNAFSLKSHSQVRLNHSRIFWKKQGFSYAQGYPQRSGPRGLLGLISELECLQSAGAIWGRLARFEHSRVSGPVQKNLLTGRFKLGQNTVSPSSRAERQERRGAR